MNKPPLICLNPRWRDYQPRWSKAHLVRVRGVWFYYPAATAGGFLDSTKNVKADAYCRLHSHSADRAMIL